MSIVFNKLYGSIRCDHIPAQDVIPGPLPPKGSLMIEHDKALGLWAMKLPSADTVVVKRTLAKVTEHPKAFLVWTRPQILRSIGRNSERPDQQKRRSAAPRSKHGSSAVATSIRPTHQSVEASQIRRLSPGVSGPEIGYITTSIILVQCALVLLSQRANLPKGGVYTTGVVFGPTDLQKRLEDHPFR
uniref:Uncharacterized protein n=1 Tax=Aegilops tauschii TaxID=37682 RepID=M8B3C7_AEGTA